jgi:hypothetical protein
MWGNCFVRLAAGELERVVRALVRDYLSLLLKTSQEHEGEEHHKFTHRS